MQQGHCLQVCIDIEIVLLQRVTKDKKDEAVNKEKADNKNTANAEKEIVVAANTANAVAIRFVFIIKTPNLTFLQITLHLCFIIHDEC